MLSEFSLIFSEGRTLRDLGIKIYLITAELNIIFKMFCMRLYCEGIF